MARRTNFLLALVASAGAWLCGARAGAQDLEPRAYANTPVGLNFAIVGYGYTHGDVAADASVPLENGKVQFNGALLGYARSLDVLGKSSKLELVVPYGYLSGSATFNGEAVSRRVTGLVDPKVRFSINFFGAPALSLEDFQSYEQDVIVGASLLVSVPLGQYDSNRLLNISTHRWAFKPELGVSKRWDRFIFEASIAGTFYTDNHAFFGQNERAQDPIGSGQLHAIYSTKRGVWGSLDFTYYAGGKVHLNGESRHDIESNTRLGGTIAIPVNRYNSIKLYGSAGVTARTGGRFDVIGAAWQVRWGGGL